MTFATTLSPGRTARGAGYQAQSVRDVKARATVTDQGVSAEERRGLRRLNQVLEQNQPLREDVPRGYYLNINI